MIDNPVGGTEGCSSIASKDGNLLFYANGETVWNRRHNIMKNGGGLMGHFSSTNGALIVPRPGENNLYYIFTTHAFQENLRYGLRYSIVDMCADNGYGEIVSESKNTSLLASAGEKLAFTKHANGVDYWLVAHQHFSSKFHAYLITEGGITSEVISDIGTFHGSDGYEDAIGQMKISPNGNKIALVMENRSPDVIDLFNFDQSSGEVSAHTNLSDLEESGGIYGVAFSPDQSKLYVSSRNGIFQFALDAGSTKQIIQTKYKIANPVTSGGLQLAPDGKLYVVRNSYLGIIQKPNLATSSCDFLDNAIYLEGNITSFALPSFLDSFEYPDKGYVPLEVNVGNSFSLCPGKVLNIDATSSGHDIIYTWQDGSNLPVYETLSEGNLSVHIADRFCSVIKNITVTSTSFSDFGPDKVACKGDSVLLKMSTANGTADWYNGYKGNELYVKESGIFWVDITKELCKVRDSIRVTFSDPPVFSLGSDTTLCPDGVVSLFVTAEANTYMWQDGSSGQSYLVTQPGTYWVIANKGACSFKDEIDVRYSTRLNFELGKDTILCINNFLLFNLEVGGGKFEWSDGTKEPNLNINRSGIYWVKVLAGNCVYIDSVTVKFTECELIMPNVFTPNGDTLNTRLVPMVMNGIKAGKLLIYNRWGTKIFETTDLNLGWAGTEDNGVYFWEIQYTTIDNLNRRIKGIVTLLR